MATLDSSISSFTGQSWSYWLEKTKKHASKNAKSEPQSVVADSNGDSMKLRKEDMNLYGLCPAQDEFYLVVCECCGQVIKPQALKKHLAQRHGISTKGSSSGSSSSSSHSHKDSSGSSSSSSSVSKSSHSHSSSSSSSHKSSKRPSSSSSTTHSHQLHTKDKISSSSSQVPKNKRTPMVKVQRIEPSSMKDKGGSTSSSKSSFVAPIPAEPPDKGRTFKEKDKELREPPAKAARIESVTSTPTTTVSVTFSSLGTPITTTAAGPVTTAAPKVTTTTTTRPQLLPLKSSEGTTNSFATPSSKSREQNSSKLTSSKTILTSVSVTNAGSSSTVPLKKPVTQASINTTSNTVAFTAMKTTASSLSTTTASTSSSMKPPVREKKNAIKCKDREYDADRHCGVWVADEGRQCTRSLTCKTHALSLRRAVKGRNKSFDDLLREHREAKEALLRAKAEASGLPIPAPSSKSSKSSRSAPSTPVTVAPSPFKLPTTEGVLSASNLLSPPPAKAVAAAPAQKEKLCLSSSFTRQSMLPIFPKTESVPLPELTNYLSSDGEEEEEDKEKTDYSTISHHPKPAAVNSFGAWKHGNGCYVFNRKEDLYRAAFYAAVERHLHPPPHKKLCVESNLPKGSTIVTNTKDPYEFSIAENASMQMRKASMASRFQVKSPSKSKAATTVVSSPPCGSATKVGDMVTSPPYFSNLVDISEPLLSPTNSLPSTPSAKRKRSGSSPVTPSRGTSNGTGTVLGSTNTGTVPCSSPIAITIPASLSFNLNSNTLSNINATLAAKKSSVQHQHGQFAGHHLKSTVVKDLNRISSSDGGGVGSNQVNGQLVISGSNLAEMTHIQLNSLSEKCAKAKSNRNANKASFVNVKNSSAVTSATSKSSHLIKSQSDISRDHKLSPMANRRTSSSVGGHSGLAFPILGSVKAGSLLPLDSSFSSTMLELAASSASLVSSAGAITLSTAGSSSSGSSSSQQPSPVPHGSPVLLSGASSPTSPLPNGLLSPTNTVPMRYTVGPNHLPSSDMKNLNLTLTEQLLAQQLPGPFSLTGVPVKSDSCSIGGLGPTSSGARGPSLPTLSPAAATAQQLAAAALNLTTQPGSCLLTTNSMAPQLYATQVLARSSPNTPLASLQLQAKGGTGAPLKGLATPTGAKVPLQPLSLTIVAPGSTVVPGSQHQQAAHMVLHPPPAATDPDSQPHATASNILS